MGAPVPGVPMLPTPLDNIPLMEFLMIVDYQTTVTDRDLVCLSLEQSVVLTI